MNYISVLYVLRVEKSKDCLCESALLYIDLDPIIFLRYSYFSQRWNVSDGHAYPELLSYASNLN